MTELSRVTKRFSPVTALEDLSFTVRPGRVTGFPGPKGAGKSTTMRVIPGLDSPAPETARVGGGELHTIQPTHVGYICRRRAVGPASEREHLPGGMDGGVARGGRRACCQPRRRVQGHRWRPGW